MDSEQVKDRPVGVMRMGEKLVFWRDDTCQVSCLRDKCVHRGVQLSKGKVIGGHLQFPFHGFECYPFGRVKLIPANGKNTPVLERFKFHSYLTYEDHGFIWIWWGDEPPADLKPPRFFDDLDDGFSYSSSASSTGWTMARRRAGRRICTNIPSSRANLRIQS